MAIKISSKETNNISQTNSSSAASSSCWLGRQISKGCSSICNKIKSCFESIKNRWENSKKEAQAKKQAEWKKAFAENQHYGTRHDPNSYTKIYYNDKGHQVWVEPKIQAK